MWVWVWLGRYTWGVAREVHGVWLGRYTWGVAREVYMGCSVLVDWCSLSPLTTHKNPFCGASVL